MNRIILIGNGFDLAHGLRTGYQDFLNDYWEKVIIEIKTNFIYNKYENDEIIINECPLNLKGINTFEDLSKELLNKGQQVNFKNKFFGFITERSNIDKWVDVENEYYIRLKMSYDKVQFPSHRQGIYDVHELNKDFENIKIKLKKYLKGISEGFNKSEKTSDFANLSLRIGSKIYSPFELRDFSETYLNEKAAAEYESIKGDLHGLENRLIDPAELTENNRNIIQAIETRLPLFSIKNLLRSKYASNYFDLIPDQTLLLNFNYTFTEGLYEESYKFRKSTKKNTRTKSIHIHGTLDEDDNNPLIFGFGDEIDDDYKSIERLNDNRYLENIKSINYLNSNNYKTLLEFVNSDSYQLFILGHSCGISDRTLLNTIFEHDNCESLKVFYHQKSEVEDNFSDIIRNISRNFNDKAKMRDRVVNKNYCESLA